MKGHNWGKCKKCSKIHKLTTKGKHLSSKTEFKKGRLPWNTGKAGTYSNPHTLEWNKKIGLKTKGNKSRTGQKQSDLEKKHRKIAMSKMSQGNIKKRKEWARQLGYKNKGRPIKHKKKIFYLGITFKSTWEVLVAKFFEQNDIEWQYEPKRFWFNEFTYLPDFYLPKIDLWIEVKGWMDERSKLQIEKFKELGKNIIVWEKKEIDIIKEWMKELQEPSEELNK